MSYLFFQYNNVIQQQGTHASVHVCIVDAPRFGNALFSPDDKHESRSFSAPLLAS